MLPRAFRFLLGAGLLLTALSFALAQDAEKDKDKDKDKPPPKKEAPAGPPPIDEVRPGEEYRRFFKKPTTVPDYWAALKFEIDVGKKDLAAMLLHGLLSLKPSEEDLVKIHEEDGMIAFLRLRNIRPWVTPIRVNEKPYLAEIARLEKSTEPESQDKIGVVRADLAKAKKDYEDTLKLNAQAYKDVEELIELATAAVKKHYSDPVRINKYVQNLKASPEEREYALKELRRSRALVVPYLIRELQTGSLDDRAAIIMALNRLGDDIVPPLVAALDSTDRVLLSDLIDILVRRRAVQAVPGLWYLSVATVYPPDIRKKATLALSGLLNEDPTRLLQAKIALVREAERYYQHEVKFADPGVVTVWRWKKGEGVTRTEMPATKAEEYFGLKYAGLALQLDPSYQPAQLVLLSLVLQKTYERASLDQPLAKTAPAVHELLATTSPELLVHIMERALNERHTPVVLGAMRTLGAMSDVRASRPTATGRAPLVRALDYPDRRVQFAAAEAMLNIPGAAATQQTTRIVEILRRTAAAEAAGKGVQRVLVAHFMPDLANQIGEAVRKAGYDPVRVHTGREMMRRLHEAADIDLILMDEALPDPGLTSLMAQLRADRNAGGLPILLMASKPEREEKLKRYMQGYKNVTVILTGFALNAEDLKIALGQRIVDPGTTPITEEEMKASSEKAIRLLGRLARGEVQGFDVRSTLDVMAGALRSGRLSPEAQKEAVEIVARIPGAKTQAELASVALDGKNAVTVRMAATTELIRHIQKHGPALNREQIDNLETMQARPDLDPALRASVSLLMGSLRPDSRTAGERLLRFQPPPAKEK